MRITLLYVKYLWQKPVSKTQMIFFSNKLLIKLLKLSILYPDLINKVNFYLVKNAKCPSCIPLLHLRYFPSHLSALLTKAGQIMLSILDHIFYSYIFCSLFSSCFTEAISISLRITISASIFGVCFMATLMGWSQSWKTRLWSECTNMCILSGVGNRLISDKKVLALGTGATRCYWWD